jgi:DNA-binding NarL/FixJ family response regulator
MIRVTIVDDHQLFADGLTSALAALPDIDVVATFGDGRAFLDEPKRPETDVLLLDLEMPRGSGLDVLRALAANTKAIVVSMHSGEQQRSKAMQLGARGFLSKETPLADVAAAVRAVHDGSLLDTDMATLREILDQYREATLDPGAASLTQRERELLGFMAHGVTATDELASALYISQKTVKNHLASIYEKLAISDRAQAAVEAIRLGFDRE